MSLTLGMVAEYLEQTPSLRSIDNKEVIDENQCKTNQTPLTLELGKLWIDEILACEDSKLNSNEKNALTSLRRALDDVPTELGYKAVKTAVTGLDAIQKNLIQSVNLYLESISQIEEHKFLLKAIVLTLRIIEYDLGKKNGPIKIGFKLFSIEILSNDQRIENYAKVKQLLDTIIGQFDCYYEENEAFVQKATIL